MCIWVNGDLGEFLRVISNDDLINMRKPFFIGVSLAVIDDSDLKPEHFGGDRKRQSDMAGAANNQMVLSGPRLDKDLHLAAANRLALVAEIVIGYQRRLSAADDFQALFLGGFFITSSPDGSPKGAVLKDNYFRARFAGGPFFCRFHNCGKRIFLPLLRGLQSLNK